MITHLYDFFSKITLNNLEENIESMMDQYGLSLLIISLFTQVKNSVSYAKVGGLPYTSTHMVRKDYLLILKPGVYHDNCRTLSSCPAVKYTWANLNKHFT